MLEHIKKEYDDAAMHVRATLRYAAIEQKRLWSEYDSMQETLETKIRAVEEQAEYCVSNI